MEETEFDIYPSPEVQPEFMKRRRKLGYDMYKLMNIDRKDKIGRLNAMKKNFEFFGAPIGMLITVDRTCGKNGWGHVGMFLENFALLAVEQGLATCFLEAWSTFPETVYQTLKIDKEKKVLWCGVALGYKDKKAKVNQLASEREPLDKFATFYSKI